MVNVELSGQAQALAVMEERQRLAQEIHDTLAQGFSSIVMQLEAAEEALPAEANTARRHTQQARDTARTSLTAALMVPTT